MSETTPDDALTPEPALKGRWAGRRLLRWAVNAWLVFHLAAIAVAPASVSPSSDLVGSAWELFEPYLDVLYLNHGYHFFAPEPAGSALLAFTAERADGSVFRGRIPSRATAPRLLYHRYFMLTEHQSGEEEEVQGPCRESYARHIGHKFHARKVTLTEVTHNLPTMERFRDGGRLDDPESFEFEPLGVYQCDGY